MNKKRVDEIKNRLLSINQFATSIEDDDLAIVIMSKVMDIFHIMNDLQYDQDVIKETIKKDCIEFFYWWANQPGSNTEQGFEEWYEKVR